MWLTNLDQIYCDPPWGELDVLEWYSSRPDLPEAATHATCTDAARTPAGTTSPTPGPGAQAAGRASTGGPSRSRRSTDVVTLRYLYDDRVYATDICAARLPRSTCDAVLDRSWTAILQTAVFGDGSGPFAAPEADKSFPTQELVVRAMWLDPI